MTPHRREPRRLAGLAGFALAAGLAACSSERYGRPPGPAPRYETAPLAPWENATTPESEGGEGTLQKEIDRALAADAGPPTKEKAPENQ